METIDDIVREMRKFADTDSQSIGRDVLRRKIQHFADRIKVAVAEMGTTTPTCKESLQVGNAAKMREALTEMVEYAQSATCHNQDAHIDHYLSQIIAWGNKARSAPPRNCDKYADCNSARKAWRKYYIPQKYSLRGYDFAIWLFAEAKGE